MKVKEFGAWPLRNISTGGRRNSYDEYNKAQKGSEHATRADEYASRSVKEYHHYAEQQDLTKELDDQQESRRQKEKEAKSRRMRMIQQVVVLVVGSVMIATSYNAMVAEQNAAQAAEPDDAIVENASDNSENGQDGNDNGNGATPDEAATQPAETVATTQASTNSGSSSGSSGSSSGSSGSSSGSSGSSSSSSGGSSGSSDSSSGSSSGGGSGSSSGTSITTEGYTISWAWNGDGTATMVVTDSSGNVISEAAATVTTSKKPAGCKTSGTITRTASASYNGQAYSDTRTETTPALGHSFDDGTEVTLSDGSKAMDYECTRCHEHFVFKNSVSEE